MLLYESSHVTNLRKSAVPHDKQTLLNEVLKRQDETIARHVPEGMTADDLMQSIITAAGEGQLGDVSKQLDKLWDTPTDEKLVKAYDDTIAHIEKASESADFELAFIEARADFETIARSDEATAIIAAMCDDVSDENDSGPQ
jgi:hypothetical protein